MSGRVGGGGGVFAFGCCIGGLLGELRFASVKSRGAILEFLLLGFGGGIGGLLGELGLVSVKSRSMLLKRFLFGNDVIGSHGGG